VSIASSGWWARGDSIHGLSRALLALYIPAALLAFCRGLLVPTLPVFADSFGISIALVGLVLAAEAVGMLLADAPAGYLVSRLKPKLAMLLGVGAVGLGVLGTALAPQLWLVLVSLAFTGAGGSLWNLSRHAYLTHATRSHNRGRTMGVFGGVSRLGSFVGPAVGGAVALTWGLRAPFFLYAAVVVVTLLLIAWLLPDEERPGGASLRRGDGSARAALRKSAPTLVNVGTAQVMVQMLRAGRSVLVPLYGTQVLGLDVGAVGVIVSVASLIDFSLFYPAGVVMDRFGRKAAIIPSFVLQGAAMALMPLTGGFVSLLLVAALGGLGNGLSTGTMMTLGSDLAPREALAEFLALWRLIGDVGFVGGPLLVGFVAQGAGLGVSGVALGALGAGAATWFAYRVPETLKRPETTAAASRHPAKPEP